MNEFQTNFARLGTGQSVAGRGAGHSHQLLSPFQGVLCCSSALCCSNPSGSCSCLFCPTGQFLLPDMAVLVLVPAPSQPTVPGQARLHGSGPVIPSQKPRNSQDGVVWLSLSLTSPLLCYTCSLSTSLTLGLSEHPLP